MDNGNDTFQNSKEKYEDPPKDNNLTSFKEESYSDQNKPLTIQY